MRRMTRRPPPCSLRVEDVPNVNLHAVRSLQDPRSLCKLFFAATKFRKLFYLCLSLPQQTDPLRTRYDVPESRSPTGWST